MLFYIFSKAAQGVLLFIARPLAQQQLRRDFEEKTQRL
jgi:hypothetical protein